MSRTRRQFTKEFKISVLTELETGKTLAQVTRENGLHPTLVCRWKKEFSADPENAFKGNGRTYKEEAKIAKLERLVGQLYAENEFLKKALETLGKRVQEERKRAGQR
jgi:transposase